MSEKQPQQQKSVLDAKAGCELSDNDLDLVSGGTGSTTTTTSDIMKTKHDTAKNSISNLH
jgi:hypothetical protein